jgi:hypothetical protein
LLLTYLLSGLESKLKNLLEKFFDWLGYAPKQETPIEFEVWPFPVETPKKRKPAVKKTATRTARKPAAAAKTARTKKAK